jgi:hypothetical protein
MSCLVTPTVVSVLDTPRANKAHARAPPPKHKQPKKSPTSKPAEPVVVNNTITNGNIYAVAFQ